jgi:RNA polymerase sigma factor (TIGR02999 family)
MQLDVTDTAGGEVTQLLRAARSGDRDAINRIVPLVYEDLRALAGRRLRHETGQRTMRPTSLVHETYMKLSNGGVLDAGNRVHFLAIASRAMRQVLIDAARRRSAAKRGGMWERAMFEADVGATELSAEETLALNDAIDELEPRQRQIVECRFFGGMEEAEIAESLGINERTVRRDWVKARAWLYRSLYGSASD